MTTVNTAFIVVLVVQVCMNFFSRSNGFVSQVSMSVGSTYVGWKIFGERVALTLNKYRDFFPYT